MKTSFIVYLHSLGIYALLTLPVFFIFYPIYLTSLYLMFIYGWFAWGIFTAVYLATGRMRSAYQTKMTVLYISIPVAVAFSFQMMEVLDAEDNVWNSGAFLFFPVIAVISGWISLFRLRKKIRAVGSGEEKTFADPIDVSSNN